MTGKTITGALVGALVLFFVGFIWYGLLPIGASSFKPLPNPEAVVEAIKGGNMESGTYIYPFMERDGSATTMEEWQALHANGPLMEIRYHAGGAVVPDPGMMINGFIHFIISALIVAILMRMALPMLSSYGRRVGFVAMLGLFAGVFTHLSGPIWMYYPADRAIMDAVYSVLSWTLAGLAMAAIIKPRAAAVTPTGTLNTVEREAAVA